MLKVLKAYTISGDEELERELCKYLDTDKNNDTKSLLLAYLKLNQEYRTFRKKAFSTLEIVIFIVVIATILSFLLPKLNTFLENSDLVKLKSI